MGKSLKINGNRVFFVGVGGISMSALAMLCHNFGAIVGGSDAVKNNITLGLEKHIKLFYGHNKHNIIKFKPNLIVYTGAVNFDNPELEFAINNNIKVMERSEFLGMICKNYKNVIAVAGTHGKTTTTAMIAEIFMLAKLNPTIHIGGEVVNLNSNFVVGGNEYFITEACEYKKSFEHINSSVAVITNIECDHMDCYKSYNDLCDSFIKFANQSKNLIVFNSNPIKEKVQTKHVQIVNFEFGLQAKNIKILQNEISFDVFEFGLYLANFKLSVFGEYNVDNALLAIGVARHFNVCVATIYDALKNFKGVKRRNEKLGKINGISVYADYCHHPTEIKKSINAFKGKFNKILCVFQPHTYSRTKMLIKDFDQCFKGVNKLIIFKTYPAREPYDFDGCETALFKKIKNKNKILALSESELLKNIVDFAHNYDAIIVLGAGDIYDIVKNGLTLD